MKRKGYISWDEYFMGVALLAAKRSKDPNTQVGACIVHNNVILSTGYNGFPYGCSDDEYPWEREGDFQNNTKYHHHHSYHRCDNICSIIPLQRVCKGYHSIGNKGGCLPL